ncbi:MAG: proline dehydrogenase family protein [Acidobacteriota bacterium]|nr:proline dehydrogenase family protein [Acidobacteriota bacterium]
MLRSFFIALSESKSIRSIAENSSIGQKVSKRFVAGMTVADLIEATVAMNKAGVHVTVDNLGENVTNREEALHSKALYHELLDEIDKRKLDANVSLKLTHMGLDVDEQLARDTVIELLEHAASIHSFIRVDMEGSPYTQRTIDFVRELHGRPGAAGHVGTVLQAYLFRTEEDVRVLCSEGIRIRLCKGAYKEAAAIAFPAKHDVDANYVKLAKILLKSGTFHGLATHDEHIINTIKAWAQQEGVPKTAFEFQMLHGVRRDLQEKLAKDGWGVRCYIPFGTEWYPYFMRRLAERPANVIFLAKNYFKG